MKTNVVMKREIGNLPVYQRTKDGYFNATELLKCWNSAVDLNRVKVPDLENRLKSGDRQVILKELQNEFKLPFNKKRVKRLFELCFNKRICVNSFFKRKYIFR